MLYMTSPLDCHFCRKNLTDKQVLHMQGVAVKEAQDTLNFADLQNLLFVLDLSE